MTSITFHTRSLTLKKKGRYVLGYYVSGGWFFTFWGAEKYVFHIAPLRITSYVIKSFWCVELSKRVSYWNKIKINIYVVSICQILQLEIPIFMYKLLCQSCLWISFSYRVYEFNGVVSLKKCKTIISVDHYFIYPNWKYWNHIQRKYK